MTDFNVFVGPDPQFCLECGGTNGDGYESEITHFASCSKAPKGKRAKMEPTRVNVDDLPSDMQEILRERADTPRPAPDAAERVKPPPSEKNDDEALRWLKSRHHAPCGDAKCDSVYCYIAERFDALLTDRAALARELGLAKLRADAAESTRDVAINRAERLEARNKELEAEPTILLAELALAHGRIQRQERTLIEAEAQVAALTREAVPPFTLQAADYLAGVASWMVDTHQSDARSPLGDALLDYASLRHGDQRPIENVREVFNVLREKRGRAALPAPSPVLSGKCNCGLAAFLAALSAPASEKQIPRAAPSPDPMTARMNHMLASRATEPTGGDVRDGAPSPDSRAPDAKESTDYTFNGVTRRNPFAR